MLVLTRKIGQRIRIGADIEVEVRDIRGNDVRLGISAPRALPVYREELYATIAAANDSAARDVEGMRTIRE